MKSNFVRQCSVGLAVGLIFTLGCARPKAEPPPRAVSTAPPVLLAQAAPAPEPAGPNAATFAGAAPQDTNAPAILERIPANAQPEAVAMSPGLAEVVKLAQAGVGEEVILAYVDKYSARFEVGAEQILYLNDLGVSSTVMTAMLKHDGSDPALATAPINTAPPPGANPPGANPPVVTAPLTPQAQAQHAPPPTVTTSVAPPPTSTEVTYFYDTLSPYGSWVYLSGYGWCWQPTVAVSVPTWRPYVDRGRWYWSDAGWYWYSDYSWGWAAFHYGRWYHHAGSGWVWRPGLAWAPSWVSWRYSDGYYGWAPLPPEAHFVHGSGFTYYGHGVSVGFEFGLSPFHYTFVGVNNFSDYAPYRYVVPHTRVQNFYRNTTVVNNYIVGNNNRIINNGIGRETVARASTTRIREVSVRETPVNNMANVRGDRIERQGNQMVVYRPQLPKDPPQVRSAQFASRAGGAAQPATVGRNGNVNANANVTTPGTTSRGQGQTGRSQGTVAARSNAGNTEAARPQPSNNEERRPVTNQRGNPNRIERATPGSVTPSPVTPSRQQTQPPSRPQTQPQPRSQLEPQNTQPRGNSPLFGSGQANATVPQNNAAAARPVERTTPIPTPRVQAQPSQNNGAANRVYPQTQAPVQPRYNTPAESRGHGIGRNHLDHSSMPPRQTEQTSPRNNAPRYTAPAQSAPVYRAPSYQAPQHNPQPSHPAGGRYSAPHSEVRSAPAAPARGGGGGGRSEGNGRGERNR